MLEGVFQDAYCDLPTGSYIRNPPQSMHTPRSDPGCVIFVKLWLFDLQDRTHVRTKFSEINSVADSNRTGTTIIPLYQDEREFVRVEQWESATEVTLDLPDGAELLVLEGSFKEADDVFRPQSWLRIPMGGRVNAKAGSEGVRMWIKTGHLRYVEPPAE